MRGVGKKITEKSKGTGQIADYRRDQILNYAKDVNDQYGRGGITAAARKFGVSTSSVSTWLRQNCGGPRKSERSEVVVRSARDRVRTARLLSSLIELRSSIEDLERELRKKRARFDKLKTRV